jgi:hypothetical protein
MSVAAAETLLAMAAAAAAATARARRNNGVSMRNDMARYKHRRRSPSRLRGDKQRWREIKNDAAAKRRISAWREIALHRGKWIIMNNGVITNATAASAAAIAISAWRVNNRHINRGISSGRRDDSWAAGGGALMRSLPYHRRVAAPRASRMASMISLLRGISRNGGTVSYR